METPPGMHKDLKAGSEAETCARRILEVVPLMMRMIRREMRSATQETLSVPQFRVLAFLGRNCGASLSALAEHLGVADATASAMVERLVRRELVIREEHPQERRRVMLQLTPAGSRLLDSSRNRARAYLATQLQGLKGTDLAQIGHALELLQHTLGLDAGQEPHP